MFTEQQKTELRKAFNQEHWLISELKAVALFVILLIIITLIAGFLGLDGGYGGNPQESYQEKYRDY
jgi:hypothetical protein